MDTKAIKCLASRVLLDLAKSLPALLPDDGTTLITHSDVLACFPSMSPLSAPSCLILG